MNNNSSKFVKITAKVLAALIAVCLVTAAVPALSSGLLPIASAEAVDYDASSKSIANINSYLSGLASGAEVNVILGNKAYDVKAAGTGIVIPAGITVNLYMNGGQLTYSNDGWQVGTVVGITNNGTLNLHAGTKSAPDPTESTAAINLVNSRTGMSCSGKDEFCNCSLECIRNSGTLTVGKGVTLSSSVTLQYDKGGAGSNSDNTAVTTGIYNTAKTAKCTIDGTTITSKSNSLAMGCRDYRSDNRVYAYGIYGGDITVNGNSKISVDVYGCCDTASVSTTESQQFLIAYDIVSDGAVSIYGGTFNYNAEGTCKYNTASNALTDGKNMCFMGNVLTNNDTVPVIADGTFNVCTKADVLCSHGDVTYREGTVTQTSTVPPTGKSMIDGKLGRDGSGRSYPNGTFSNGKFKDETGAEYSVDDMATADNGKHPTAIVRGAKSGYSRVHVIYRYFNVDKSVDETIGNGTGWTMEPVGYVVKTALKLSGLVTNQYVKKQSDELKASGGAVQNSYFWTHKGTYTYVEDNSWYSDIKYTAKPTTFDSMKGKSSPVYIFVDYYRVDAKFTGISSTLSSTKELSVDYTGQPLDLVDNLKIAIKTGVNKKTLNTDSTDDYDLKLTGAENKIPVSVSYKVKGSDTEPVQGTPTELGVYEITVSIEDDVIFNPDDFNPTLHKNRYGATETFTVTINPADVTPVNLPESVTLTYGQKLSEVFSFGSYSAVGIKNEKIDGYYTFADAADSTSFKNVGNGVVRIKFVKDTTGGKNPSYKEECVFEVKYTVAPAVLSIVSDSKEITYGDPSVDFSISIYGLVGNDIKNSAKINSDVSAAIIYLVKSGSNYYSYSPDTVGAGDHDIQAKLDPKNTPAVLDNYTILYSFNSGSAYENGVLRVNKKGLTVVATADSRQYEPSNYNVTVRIAITDGKYKQGDDVSFAVGTGKLGSGNDNFAGTRLVTGVTKAYANSLLQGAAKNNYEVANINETITVEITKADPVVIAPSTVQRYYNSSTTLKDVPLVYDAVSAKGTWTWADTSICPTVNKTSYRAKFTPNDSDNYNDKYLDVTLKVLPTQVEVTYHATVQYGDPCPNITDYAFISSETGFKLSNVTNSDGNISPSTTYVQGSKPGTYTVTINVSNFRDKDGNYTFISSPGTITVTKREMVFTIQDKTITYGDSFDATSCTIVPDLTCLAENDDITAVTDSGREPTFVFRTDYQANVSGSNGAGTYNIYATQSFTNSEKYDVKIVNGKLKVNKASLVLTIDDMTVPYGSEVPDLESKVRYNSVNNEKMDKILANGTKINYSTDYVKYASVNSDGYNIYIDISAADIPNYDVSISCGKIKVRKAKLKIAVKPEASITYTQTLADAVFTGATVNGEVGNDIISGKFVYPAADTVPNYSEVATSAYSANFIPDDTDNYEIYYDISPIYLTVNKKPITGSLSVNGSPMINETLTVDTSSLEPAEEGVYTFKWYVDGVELSDSESTANSFTLKEAYLGKKLTVKVTALSPYTGTAEYVIKSIAPLLTPVTNIINGTAYDGFFTLSGLDSFGAVKEVPYDGTQHGISFTQIDATRSSHIVGNINIKYNGSDKIPNKVGTYKVTLDVDTPENIQPDEAGRTTYSPATNIEIGTIVITKATFNVSITVADKVYDGNNIVTSYTATESGKVNSDDVALDKDNTSFAFQKSDAGNNLEVIQGNSALKGEDKDNYELNIVITNTGTVSITPRELEVTAVASPREYAPDSYEAYVSFEINKNSFAPGETLSDVNIDYSNVTSNIIGSDNKVGIHSVEISGVALTGTKNQNYTLKLINKDSVTVEIQKATPTGLSLPQVDDMVYDAGRRLSDINIGGGWEFKDGNTVPTVGTGTYKVIYTPTDTKNYKQIEDTVTFTVSPAKVTVTASNRTVVYGQNEPTYKIEIKGLTGADTEASLTGFVTASCAYKAGSDVGKYDIVCSGGYRNSNYTFTYVNGSLTVMACPVSVIAQPISRPYEKDNRSVEVGFSAISGLFTGDADDCYLSQEKVTGIISDDNAGEKQVTFDLPTLEGSKAGNYTLSLANPDATVVITKAHLTGINFPASGTIDFGQRLSETVFDEFTKSPNGTYSMKNPNAMPAAVGVTSDVYEVVFTPDDGLNYAEESRFITLTVRSSEIVATVIISGKTQVGNTLMADIENIPDSARPYLTYRWYRLETPTQDVYDGILLASGDITEYTVTDDDVNGYIACVVRNKSDSPYIAGGKGVSSKVEANKTSFWAKIVQWFYNIIASISQLFGSLGG